MDAPLRVERPRSGVVLLTLSLPDRRNAMTPELTAAWARAIKSLRQDESVRAVVVTGAGTAFCAGGDLSWLGQGEPAAKKRTARVRPAVVRPARTSKRRPRTCAPGCMTSTAPGCGSAISRCRCWPR